MTFYDYDLRVTPQTGEERYVLQAYAKPLGKGRWCTVKPAGTRWCRTTQWGSRHGRRYEFFTDLRVALESGIKWARRRERQDGGL